MRTQGIVLVTALVLVLTPAPGRGADDVDASGPGVAMEETELGGSAGTTSGSGTGSESGTGTTGTETDTTGTQTDAIGTTDATDAEGEATPSWAEPTYGNAAKRPITVKRAEARVVCAESAPEPPGRLLAIGGTSGGSASTPWVLFAAAIAVAALLVALAAFLVRRRRAAVEGAKPAARGPLETVATIVAIFGGITGLAVQFVPGLGADQSAGPSAKMTVRDVDARIRRGEYVRKVRTGVKVEGIDRSEVGNVVWLQLELTGYEDKRPYIQFGLHDPARGGALIDRTAKEVELERPTHKQQTFFVPIWVGYPKRGKFEAHFRLVEGREVRELASTGPMRSAKYRYACDSNARRQASQR